MTDLHVAQPGQSPLCEHYLLMQRAIIEAQGRLIADLQRRLDGQPVTQVFLDAR